MVGTQYSWWENFFVKVKTVWLKWTIIICASIGGPIIIAILACIISCCIKKKPQDQIQVVPSALKPYNRDENLFNPDFQGKQSLRKTIKEAERIQMSGESIDEGGLDKTKPGIESKQQLYDEPSSINFKGPTYRNNFNEDSNYEESGKF